MLFRLMLEGNDLSAEAKLRALVDVATGDENIRYGGVLVESSIRDWGRYDQRVADIMEVVDRQRLDYLESLFTACGAEGEAIRINSAILYGALVGLEPLSSRKLVDLRGDLRALLDKLLASL